MLATQNGKTTDGMNPMEVTRKSWYVGICSKRFTRLVTVLMTKPIRAVKASTIDLIKPIIVKPYLLSAKTDPEAKKSLESNRKASNS